jgi:hypothetical protein
MMKSVIEDLFLQTNSIMSGSSLGSGSDCGTTAGQTGKILAK